MLTHSLRFCTNLINNETGRCCLNPMQRYIGLIRSLITYYGNPFNTRRLRRLYAQFLGSGDLYFDIGAHVGNRIWAALKMGSRVVAVEPNPQLMDFLQRWYGKNHSVTLIQKAIGAKKGEGSFYVSERVPTVSTASRSWINARQNDRSFKGIAWETELNISLITLEQLIDSFGLPDFCKLDVEGYEFEALQGLKSILPALSFEFIPSAVDLPEACIQRLENQSRYEYNWCLAEQFWFGSKAWLSADDMMDQLKNHLRHGRSGDIYARLKTQIME